MKRAGRPGIIEALGADAAEDIGRALAGFARGTCCLAGVSGGADSVCLLHVLRACGFKRIVACHLDHGLRGGDARADAVWVGRLAARLGCECRLGRVDVRAEAKAGGQSIEEAGRLARHRFFAGVAREFRCRRLFLGHHADDRAESLLFNLLRGAGMAGLGTLRADSMLRMDGVDIRVLRPLLGLRSGALRAAMAAAGLRWREDATNARAQFARNRLRHEALPLLAEIMGRDVVPPIARAADILEQDNSCLDALVAGLSCPPDLPVKAVTAQPPAMQRRLLKRWIGECGATTPTLREVDAVRELCVPGAAAASVNLPQAQCVRRRRGRLHIEPQCRASRPAPANSRPKP